MRDLVTGHWLNWRDSPAQYLLPSRCMAAIFLGHFWVSIRRERAPLRGKPHRYPSFTSLLLSLGIVRAGDILLRDLLGSSGELGRGRDFFCLFKTANDPRPDGNVHHLFPNKPFSLPRRPAGCSVIIPLPARAIGRNQCLFFVLWSAPEPQSSLPSPLLLSSFWPRPPAIFLVESLGEWSDICSG